MSIENVKKLELGMDKSCNCEKFVPAEQLTPEIEQQLINEGIRLEEEAFATKDVDVLNRAIDYFLEEPNNIGLENGGCESLLNDIFNNFTVEQIIEVLYKKFDILLEKNESRAEDFFISLINTGYFEGFRDIFNKTRSSKSESFLKSFAKYYAEDYPEEIAILREDMETWPKK